jgi:hypothetical protein
MAAPPQELREKLLAFANKNAERIAFLGDRAGDASIVETLKGDCLCGRPLDPNSAHRCFNLLEDLRKEGLFTSEVLSLLAEKWRRDKAEELSRKCIPRLAEQQHIYAILSLIFKKGADLDLKTIRPPKRPRENEPATRRVRLKRDKLGNLVHGYDVYIGRKFVKGGWNLPESIWHNPYSLYSCGNKRDVCIAKFEAYFRGRKDLHARLPELRGKVLGCWCEPNEACHGDVLIKMLDELHPADKAPRKD